MRISDRTYTILKRTQVLSGVVAVGLFLVSHIATNARAIAGAAVFDRTAAAISRIPFLPVLELGGVALPMLVHVALGPWLATTAQGAADTRGYARVGPVLAQRITGFVLVVYVTFYMWSTRLSPDRSPGGTEMFAQTARTLSEPGMLAFHITGMLAAAYHFGNGLAALAGPWGLALDERAQRRAAQVGLWATIVHGLVGVHALRAFVHPAFRWLAPAGAR